MSPLILISSHKILLSPSHLILLILRNASLIALKHQSGVAAATACKLLVLILTMNMMTSPHTLKIKPEPQNLPANKM